MMKRSVFFYFLVLAIFLVGTAVTLDRGRHLLPRVATATETAQTGVASAKIADATGSVWSAIDANLKEPLSRLFIQLLVILLATWAVRQAFIKIGQPGVVGEMFAGVLLGPSLLGLLFPSGFAFIFPDSSLGTLRLLSQIGVCLFMFAVGMDLDVAHLRGKAPVAIVVSHTSILLPYLFGMAAALGVYPALAGAGTSFLSFALFMGIAMSVTAFPVLARILQERRLEKTPLGSTALTCAAIDDVTAWCLLAFVVAIARANGFGGTAISVLLVVAFVVMMLRVIRPQLPRWFKSTMIPSHAVLAAVLMFTFASALTTELIGIHALFGAFLAGVVMPRDREFRDFLKVRVENFSSIFLLPLFFAFSGLRTQIGLINDAHSLMICGWIILIATAGKLGGSMIAARFTGMNWNDSFALGALMNTRGLMELIAINIGYDLNILSRQMFTMLVLMALATTFMTGPLLTLAEYWKARRAGLPVKAATVE